MKIAPIDIAHKTFGRKMMGFDPDEVIDFLRMVSTELESLIREKNQLKDNIREKELQVIEFKERDDLLKNTITTATKMSDKIQSDAEREAKLILSDAQQHAEIIVRDARDSLKKIYQEISDLKKIRLQFENNLKAMIESHLTMMEQANRIMPSPQFTQDLANQSFVEIQEEVTTEEIEAEPKASGVGSSAYPTIDLSQELKTEVAEAMKDI